MAYDSAATRARLLDAAYDEFVGRGLAGARVDRIATAAEANKQAIYAYFGSKDALFDAVLDARLRVLADIVPFTPADLPDYAARLFDRFAEDPGLLRLTQWKALEHPDASDAELAAHLSKSAEVSEALGLDAERGMDALMIALAVAQAWSITPPAIRTLGAPHDDARRARHRAAVIAAVRAYVETLEADGITG
ncbi:TetR/AcrR family transcriptional regulator [Herbidospora mongoliensis]|uniref:TetR/AcrR family transcriptional regulator n=1 Tax=Herbidospora mongoliensis TaxID=688067 RepID=UPI0008347180|nr:TetR family transcriptional regulator [Herbidospora mongoliensis]